MDIQDHSSNHKEKRIQDQKYKQRHIKQAAQQLPLFQKEDIMTNAKKNYLHIKNHIPKGHWQKELSDKHEKELKSKQAINEQL